MDSFFFVGSTKTAAASLWLLLLRLLAVSAGGSVVTTTTLQSISIDWAEAVADVGAGATTEVVFSSSASSVVTMTAIFAAAAGSIADLSELSSSTECTQAAASAASSSAASSGGSVWRTPPGSVGTLVSFFFPLSLLAPRNSGPLPMRAVCSSENERVLRAALFVPPLPPPLPPPAGTKERRRRKSRQPDDSRRALCSMLAAQVMGSGSEKLSAAPLSSNLTRVKVTSCGGAVILSYILSHKVNTYAHFPLMHENSVIGLNHVYVYEKKGNKCRLFVFLDNFI
jgi:hypothetical protein